MYSALMALLGAIMIQIGTNFANDYFDYQKGADQKDRLGPTRVTQAGLVNPSTMKSATIFIFTIAILAGTYLVWRGGLPILLIGLLSIIFGILYTAGPFPLGYIGLGDVFVLIFFGPVAVGGTYYVQTLEINIPVILSGLAPGLFSVAILTVNNLRDINSDSEVGKKTLAVRFGTSFSKLEYLLSIVLACFIPLLLYINYQKHLYSVITLVVLIIAVPSIKKLFTTEGRELNNVLASTGKLLLLYSLLFSIGWLL
ncbi:MAG: 1,4-dihydroxy-2-naphthoate polyprenyltransferase [Candidatus Zixiibacteriota bacterium]